MLASIVIPTRDRNALLAETLQSVAAQTWRDLDVVVVDDGEGESALDVAARFARQGLAVRVIERRAVRPDAVGAQVSRNAGLAAAHGDAVLFLDSDDLLAPECLENRIAVLRADERLGFVVGQCAQFDGQPGPGDPLWREWNEDDDDLLMFLAGATSWQTSGPLWRRAALEQVGPWDEALEGAGHDYEFHIRALAIGIAYRRMNSVDYYWRKPRPDSFSGDAAMKRQHREGAHILAFVHGISAVEAHEAWTDQRCAAAWREAVRLGTTCRLFGGTCSTARSGIVAAYAAGCASRLAMREADLCLAAWFRVGGRIPSLAWLSRRGLNGQVP